MSYQPQDVLAGAVGFGFVPSCITQLETAGYTDDAPTSIIAESDLGAQLLAFDVIRAVFPFIFRVESVQVRIEVFGEATTENEGRHAPFVDLWDD